MRTRPASDWVGTGIAHDAPTAYVYRYDVLNRLKTATFYEKPPFPQDWQVPFDEPYSTSYTYDPSGNLQTLTRNAFTTGVPGSSRMDSLGYTYWSGRNQLKVLSDAVPTTGIAEDLEGQGAGPNYLYDRDGNLIRDLSEGTWMQWNAQGKVSRVETRNPAAGISATVKYLYNAAGSRVRKIVIDHLSTSTDTTRHRVTYYVRDANDKVVAIYEGDWHALAVPPRHALRRPARRLRQRRRRGCLRQLPHAAEPAPDRHRRRRHRRCMRLLAPGLRPVADRL